MATAWILQFSECNLAAMGPHWQGLLQWVRSGVVVEMLRFIFLSCLKTKQGRRVVMTSEVSHTRFSCGMDNRGGFFPYSTILLEMVREVARAWDFTSARDSYEKLGWWWGGQVMCYTTRLSSPPSLRCGVSSSRSSVALSKMSATSWSLGFHVECVEWGVCECWTFRSWTCQ